MGSLSDQMLAGGCALHVEAAHGERIKVLDGPDAGAYFTAVREIQEDVVLDTELGADPRAKRILRFREGHAPTLGSQDKIQTDDGKIYRTVRRPDAAYLTVDFELTEVVQGKDQ